MLDFWRRALDIYSHYKLSQLRITLQAAALPPSLPPSVRQARVQEWWDRVHARNSDRMLALCLSLRGFYLKAGQFLGTRPDFMPAPYILKLATLHDRVPPLSEEAVREVLEEELGGRPWEEVFLDLNLKTCVGSASICQVHEGRLRGLREEEV
jgi:predicted unusual protein kinase regulating ubiquinone biosynthesis (AarF/ABC1/UbiB family)